MRTVSIENITVEGEELTEENLGRVFGGLPNDGNTPTINWDQGSYDAPGTAHLTRSGRPDTQL